ncbi:hypothetical protein NQ314_007312 [Rhamnusium bicolor]|uniref:Uncharacterized protein n=1 Tax=Rhamnusium bicolor TaxID=1586634 RepID=A0AAV8YPV9_9CUCU|nr:hypothetical protein NQ314_007312 [Rhamnusium bicolor]
MGESCNNILRHPGNTVDAALSIEHRRYNGHLIQISLLEGVLLRVHEKTEEEQEDEIFFSHRGSSKSRNNSFRRSVRTSTRSADSGLAFSDIGPSSHSDTELR